MWNQAFTFSAVVRPSSTIVPDLDIQLFDFDSATAADEIGVASVAGASILKFCWAPSGWTSQGDVVVQKDGDVVTGKDGGPTRHVEVNVHVLISNFKRVPASYAWRLGQAACSTCLLTLLLGHLQRENQPLHHAQG